MSRNVEKASKLLNRWTALKESMGAAERGGGGAREERRPYLASLAATLPEAERWRRDLVRELTRKVSEIQNAGLGEARVRDLNDEINKGLRELHHWTRRVAALGGPDHAAGAGARALDAGVLELPGAGGYKYFGAARELPGVRELFAAAADKDTRRSRADLARHITPEYYGFREDADGALAEEEARVQPAATAAAEAAWEARRAGAAAARAARRAPAGAAAAAAAAAGRAGRRGRAPGAAGDGWGDDDDDEEEDEGDGGEGDWEGAGGAGGGGARAGGALAAPAGGAAAGAGAGAAGARVPAPLSAAQVEALLAERARALLLERYGAGGGEG